MKVDPNIRRELDLLPVAYTIRKTRDHYFAVIGDHKPICIGGNHDKNKCRLVKNTMQSLRKIRLALEAK